MLNSIGNGFFWAFGVVLFFGIFGAIVIIVLMIIRRISDHNYKKINKK